MEFLVTDVVKSLAAVSAMVDACSEAVFAKESSLMRIMQTGDKTLLKGRGGTMDVSVDVEVMGADSSEGSVSSGMHRVISSWCGC